MMSPVSKRPVFHILPNAHLDPVWLWDWQEGLNEGVITARGVLALMDEFPELTFVRGESSLYEHIERTDPATFARVVAMVEAGRWDVVGGTYVQPDSNLASAEGLCRQFEVGLEYFRSRFGRVPTVAWQADCFGHTPGWPSILSGFGMRGFAFTRPQQREFPMASPVFRWLAGGQSVLCYRQHWPWYCSERDNVPAALDETLAASGAHAYRNRGVFLGLGNHGGGPSRRHIREIALWAVAHPEVEVRYSTLHGFFAALEAELQGGQPLPEHTGDMGFCLRGCYSSAMRLKAAHRRAEASLLSAERTQAVVSRLTGVDPAFRLDLAWKGSLFNAFHDILPGSSIERALDDQIALAGSVLRASQEAGLEALNRLAMRVDTSVPPPATDDSPTDAPLLVWNPLPRACERWVELEASLDYRPIAGASAEIGSLPLRLTGPDGEIPAFQEIQTEHRSMRGAAWRKRVVFRTMLPPLGWKVFRLGFDRPESPLPLAASPPRGPLSFEGWDMIVTDSQLLEIRRDGQPVFVGDGLLRVESVEDPWGSWGGMNEEPDSFTTETVRDHWRITDHRLLESGPQRSVLWTAWEGGHSRLELRFSVLRGARHLQVSGRLLLAERSARVKLVVPADGTLSMQTPASAAERPQPGHLPCGRWVRCGDSAFVSDVLSDVDRVAGELRFTLARASRYADDVPTPPEACPWLPSMDAGEHKFQLWIVPGDGHLDDLAEDLLHPPTALPVPAHPGEWGDHGSLAGLDPGKLQLLALRCASDGCTVVRIQNASDVPCEGTITLLGTAFATGLLAPWEIRTLTLPPA